MIARLPKTESLYDQFSRCLGAKSLMCHCSTSDARHLLNSAVVYLQQPIYFQRPISIQIIDNARIIAKALGMQGASNNSLSYQLSILRPVETEGVGLHTLFVRTYDLSRPRETRIVFRRVDLDNFEIEAHGRNVAATYATSLMKTACCSPPPSICSPRSILAASIMSTWKSQDALELPILDGSAQPS